MKTLVLYTLPPKELSAGRAADEFALNEAAEEIVRCLLGAEAIGVHGAADEILTLIDAVRPGVVFNLCEAPLGRPELEPHVAALLEWRAIPFTGCGSGTLALCRRKDRTKAVLAAAGIAVPRTNVFPCIVKPADEDGSTSMYHDSVCEDAAAIERAIARIPGQVIVEEFLPGKEFVVSLWGRHDPDSIAIGEIDYTNGLRLLTYAAKWDAKSADYQDSQLDYDAVIAPVVRSAIEQAARTTWHAVGARGYLRLDIRLDKAEIPHVIDVNPNPEMSPEVGMHRAVCEAGWTWSRFVQQQVEWAGANKLGPLG